MIFTDLWNWLRGIAWPKTVASVTAEFNKVVDDLKAIEQRAAKRLDFHSTMAKLHAEEQAAAKRVGAKIKELVV